MNTTCTESSETARISADLACSCGYNLRGLPSSGNCPECGRPIGDALSSLPRIDRRWGRCVATGVMLLTCLYVPPFRWTLGIFTWSPLPEYFVGPLVAGICLVGAWLVSSREPDERGDAVSRGWLIRGAALCWIVFSTASVVTQLLNLQRDRTITIAANAAATATIFAAFARYRVLARRVRDPALQRWFVALQFCMPIVLSTDWLTLLKNEAMDGWHLYRFLPLLFHVGIVASFVAVFLCGRLHQRLLIAAR